ncbi:MAG TPA: hypothetical protein DDX91_02200 [Ruminococcaceae bacterium]|nr:hypothetical protein [Oscillospiraceae bacterium]
MILKTSIVCLLLILYMCLFYYRKPHIKTKSTRIFFTLTVIAVINALFDLITLYTVNHRDTVPEALNLAAHIVYLLSILMYAYFLFLYMKSCLQGSIKINRTVQILQSIPVFISTIGIFFLPISYIHGETTDYSLGAKAYALYGSVVVYLVLILYYCLRYWNILDSEKRLSIILAVPIYIITSAIQIMFPESLLVILCSTLILMGLILSNENTEKYMDEKTDLFNQYSFELVLDEYDFSKRRGVIGLLCFCRESNSFDLNQDIRILQDIYRETKLCRLQSYRVCENGVVFIGSSEERTKAVLGKIKESISKKYGRDSVIVETRVVAKSEYSDKLGLMRIIIGFCRVTGSRFAFIDYLTHIHNRNALERDMPGAEAEGKGWYVIADLNDLKVVNDTLGHSAGDEMLQGFAEILSKAAGGSGRAYRQGGDEFAVLYGGDVEQFLEKLSELCDLHNSNSSIPISYAAGYCSLSEKEFVNIADKMMYENKREMKKRAK